MCGIVGIFGNHDVSLEIYYGLRALQHRGQSSSGLITFDGNIYPKKDYGTVSKLLKKYSNDESDLMEATPGPIGIGHTRYSTSGGDSWKELKKNAQPEYVVNPFVAACHNGNIYNGIDVLKHCHRKPRTDCDIQYLLLPMAEYLPSYTHINFEAMVQAGEKVMDLARGSYSTLFLTAGKDRPYMVAFTDPHKIRPMVMGKKNGAYYFASESAVLSRLGVDNFQDVEAGTILSVHPEYETPLEKRLQKKKKYPCMFEYVYFADPNSWIEGRSVHQVRVDIGKELARRHPVENADIVVPVPESGRRYGIGFSHGSGTPLEEGIKKDKRQRAFILQKQKDRDRMANNNLSAIRAALDGKKVVLTDDSLVRGTNITRVIQKVRKAGAKEVHLRIGCPPLVAPCFLGIDMKSKREFIAIDHEKEDFRDWDEIATMVGADSLAYGDIGMLKRAILKDKDEDDYDICHGCLNFPDGYPPDMREEIHELASRAVCEGCRVYDPGT